MEETTLQDTSFNFQRSSSPSVSSPEPKGSKRFLMLIIAVLVLGAVIFAASRFLGSKGEDSQKANVTPTPTEVIILTDTPSPTPAEVSPTPKSSPTATPKPTLNPVDPVTGLDRSDLSVEVRNGGGVAGVAGKAADFLKNLGYKVTAIGNAETFDYEKTTIEVKSAKSSFLNLLKKDLAADYTIGSTSADLSATTSADALVIVGKE